MYRQIGWTDGDGDKCTVRKTTPRGIQHVPHTHPKDASATCVACSAHRDDRGIRWACLSILTRSCLLPRQVHEPYWNHRGNRHYLGMYWEHWGFWNFLDRSFEPCDGHAGERR